MDKVITIGLDIAKTVFQVHGVPKEPYWLDLPFDYGDSAFN
ncbi:hypothetical protein [Magnetospirillum gryphiswaldense]|uniref:Transposase n=1 Tax=Magnetospirillum gryphiswaldense TaxID=55518 RepID=A4TVY0_9PROT|nr:hypothetical protein [Magnetospirillum gryphiswaldense]AVM76177.1 hypothetical protein MSR1_37190 [Magnetospirillum gryphiswaldense MSR-1]AVM80080.1 hypothetical protein MSR1L_37190 [Magnetospirillum gryphiswaldense]CAM74787.1 hypothetical protein MGR_2783 [Magnetospirillum gryphiswaldense MSR-1]